MEEVKAFLESLYKKKEEIIEEINRINLNGNLSENEKNTEIIKIKNKLNQLDEQIDLIDNSIKMREKEGKEDKKEKAEEKINKVDEDINKIENEINIVEQIKNSNVEENRNKKRAFDFLDILPKLFALIIVLGAIYGLRIMNEYGILSNGIKVILGYVVSVFIAYIGYRGIKKGKERYKHELLLFISFAFLLLTTVAGNIIYKFINLPIAVVLVLISVLFGMFIMYIAQKSSIISMVVGVSSGIVYLLEYISCPHLLIYFYIVSIFVASNFILLNKKNKRLLLTTSLISIFNIMIYSWIFDDVRDFTLIIITLMIAFIQFIFTRLNASNLTIINRMTILFSAIIAFMIKEKDVNQNIEVFVVIILMATLSKIINKLNWKQLTPYIYLVLFTIVFELMNYRFGENYFLGIVILTLLMFGMYILGDKKSVWMINALGICTILYTSITHEYYSKISTLVMCGWILIIFSHLYLVYYVNLKWKLNDVKKWCLSGIQTLICYTSMKILFIGLADVNEKYNMDVVLMYLLIILVAAIRKYLPREFFKTLFGFFVMVIVFQLITYHNVYYDKGLTFIQNTSYLGLSLITLAVLIKTLMSTKYKELNYTLSLVNVVFTLCVFEREKDLIEMNHIVDIVGFLLLSFLFAGIYIYKGVKDGNGWYLKTGVIITVIEICKLVFIDLSFMEGWLKIIILLIIGVVGFVFSTHMMKKQQSE